MAAVAEVQSVGRGQMQVLTATEPKIRTAGRVDRGCGRARGNFGRATVVVVTDELAQTLAVSAAIAGSTGCRVAVRRRHPRIGLIRRVYPGIDAVGRRYRPARTTDNVSSLRADR